MKKQFQQSKKNNKPKAKKQVRSMDDLFDLQEQNFDKMQMPEVNDPEYSKMLKQNATKKVKTNNFFENNHKYKGANADQLQDQHGEQHMISEEDEDLNQNQQSDQDQKDNYKNDIRKSLREMEKQKKHKSKLMEEQIKIIEEQDQKVFQDIKKQDNDIEAGKSLKNQLNCFSKLVQLRYYSQGGLQQIKKYPVTKENLPYSQQLHKAQKQAEREILNNISLLVQASNSLAKKSNIMKTNQQTKPGQQKLQSEQSDKFVDQLETLLDQEQCEKLQSKRFDPQALFAKYLQNTKDLRSSLEKELIKWSQKTALNNLSATNNQYSYLIMQTPVGQANKVVQNFQRAANKAQQKRGTFKILFEEHQDVRKPNCKQIFDDYELFHQLQKQFQKQLNQQDDPQMLVNDTLKYLKQRQNRSKVQKDVDRRASKNRKLRYDIHPKLLNFMTSKNANLLEARDQIVNNIFNHGKNEHQQVEYIDM